MTITGKSDMDLIKGLHNGEELAIRCLYDMNYKGLCYYANSILHNTLEAEDISTESFLKLLNKKEDFLSIGQVRTFLYKVTHNACIDLLRKNNRTSSHNDRLMRSVETTYREAAEQELLTAKVLQLIHTEMNRLPAQCKKVFQYTFLEGRSTAEIAEMMDIRPQTVLNQKNKALSILRSKIDKEGFYHEAMFSFCLYLLCNN